MSPKYTIILSITVFLGLIFYNQNLAKKSLEGTKESSLNISLTSYPESLKVNGKGNIIWEIDAPRDLSTNITTIYWSTISSPSALTKNDSPAAVGYSNYLLDYTSGNYYLPANFSGTLSFEKPQTIWYRAYAKVSGNHLWSEEKSLVITP